MGATVHIIEPCGFVLDDTKIRRAGMDYMHKVNYVRHLDWQAFLNYRHAADEARVASHGEPRAEGGSKARGAMPPSRLLLLETDGATPYTEISYQPTDYIVFGRESAGTPAALYAQMDTTLTIPMVAGMRSLNVAMSAGMVVAEACRQMNWKFA